MVTPSDPHRLFVGRPVLYARHRPRYPRELYEHLARRLPADGTGRAWDCATGSGQVAVDLVEWTRVVVATDVAPEQIAVAASRSGVHYGVAEAERAPLPDDSVDLVTVACGLHWFDRDRFFGEVERVLVPGGLFAAWAYGPCHLEPECPAIEETVDVFAEEVLGPFWSPGNELTNTRYRTLELPFPERPWPEVAARREVDLEGYLGYLRTWSAVQRYLRTHGTDPVDDLEEEVAPRWGDPAGTRRLVWPLFGRIGRT